MSVKRRVGAASRRTPVVGIGLIILVTVVCSLGASGCAPEGLILGDGKATASAVTDSQMSGSPVSETAIPTATTEAVASELANYTNREYGFSFWYPSGWAVTAGQNYVSLAEGTVNLVVGYRHATEDPNICCRNRLPEGEVIDVGSVACAGETVSKSVLVCEGKTKAVLYGDTEEISVGDLRFLFYLEDFDADYEAANIPERVQMQVDQVVGSVETFEPAAEFETATRRPTKLPATPDPTPTAAVAPTSTATRVPVTAEAGEKGANLRSGPGTDYGLQGYLEPGEHMEVIGRYEGWWRVAYDNGEAWVFSGVVDASGGERVPEVERPPTKVPSSPTLIPPPAAPAEIEETRWIDVDLSEQRLRAYENGEVVRTTLVSTGLPRSPTVRGQFRIWIKLRYDDMEGPDYYLEDVPYVMYFYQGYGLHGTFWHSNFGQRMSHGCVNLPTSEAEWVFNFVDVGTLVNVHE
jgi:lipoprotein-anchoring transpeptidase ErfK/SrfK